MGGILSRLYMYFRRIASGYQPILILHCMIEILVVMILLIYGNGYHLICDCQLNVCFFNESLEGCDVLQPYFQFHFLK